MASKITIKERYEEVREILENVGRADLVEFIDGRIAQTVKCNAIKRKPTARQVENEIFKDDILTFMLPGRKYTANDILESVPSVIASGMSLNRVSALLTQLVNNQVISRMTESRKSYYTVNT